MKWLVALVIASTGVIAHAAEIVTQLKTLLPLAIPAGKELRAAFDGLRPEALQLGLGEAVVIGSTRYEEVADKATRVFVQWHSVGLTSGPATRVLKVPLASQFRTGDVSLPPNTLLAARGDFDAFVEDFLALKESLKKGTPRDLVRQTNNNSTETTTSAGADALSPSGGGGYAPGNGGGGSWSNDNNGIKTDLITTQWQACQPRVDRAGGKTYAQARKIEITESGRVMSTGNCEDHGTVAEITRRYGKPCEVVVDVANRKVYEQFMELSNLDGKELEISLCTVDFTKFTEILGNETACGYRHDFNSNTSIKQEKLYYNDAGGNVVEIRDCGDSNKAFTHYSTQNTCAPTIDMVNRQVFLNVRTAFKDSNGAELYASDCRPDGNASFPVSEEFCSPKYEHDFINNVSYYSTRPYYVDGSGKAVYVGTCARSPQASFPHRKVTTSCDKRNDDANLRTFFSEKKEIETPDGVLEIAPCTESQQAVSYAYVGISTGPDVLVRDSFLVTSTTTLAALAGVPSDDPKYGVKPVANESMCTPPLDTSVLLKLNRPSSLVQPFLNTFDSYVAPESGCCTVIDSPMHPTVASRYGFSNRLWKQPTSSRYLRGDGSYYEIPVGGNFWLQMQCSGTWR